MCDPIIAGVATFAQGALGAVGSHQSAQAQADFNNEATRRDYEYKIKMREADWNRQLAIYNNQKADFKNEVGANASAADRAYASEQYRLNEQFQQAAFQKQDMLAQLVQSQGQIANSGITGKSAAKMNQAALAAFGRNNATIAENLASARTAMINRNEETRLQLQSANNRAWNQVAMKPVPGLAPMQPMMQSGPSGSSLALGIAGAALGGLGTYMNMKAPSQNLNNFNSPSPVSPFQAPTSTPFSTPQWGIGTQSWGGGLMPKSSGFNLGGFGYNTFGYN